LRIQVEAVPGGPKAKKAVKHDLGNHNAFEELLIQSEATGCAAPL
jgi:hypothetical protein